MSLPKSDVGSVPDFIIINQNEHEFLALLEHQQHIQWSDAIKQICLKSFLLWGTVVYNPELHFSQAVNCF